jgi:50S ribosomal subunit-associated GTPase HflX
VVAFVVRTPNEAGECVEKSQARSQVRKDDRAEDRLGIKIALFPNQAARDTELMAYKYTAPATFHRSLLKDKYRILIVGHANAGKTSILQRVADTTNSPAVYRGNKEVRDLPFYPCQSDLTSPRFNLKRP